MRKKITLSCSVCSSRNYSTMKNSDHQQERLEVKKYCKNCNEHTVHRETK
ncbi:50S ribosomal protein L33 [Bacillus sp. B15-48]|nr:50S ribosomal protein L33 [Bacillus sp. B15-48]MBM4764957.1 50S ribosomal protein L33 [Bacillus sp. B15-48]